MNGVPRQILERAVAETQFDARTLTLRVSELPVAESEHTTDFGLRDASDDLQFTQTLGRGGMGIVRAARQRSMQREVAVKVPAKVLQGAELERFVHEARVTGALQHPAIVPVYSIDVTADGQPAMVMPRLAGIDWEQRIDRDRIVKGEPLRDLAEHLEILERVVEAVAFAHERGVIHRDLKPGNVRVGRHGQVHVLDWGIAVRASGFGQGVLDDALDQLRPASEIRQIEGTLPYMAPEIAIGASDKISFATDIFQLGAILHELLTGAPPFDPDPIPESMLSGKSLVSLLFQIAVANPKPVSGAPAALLAVCERALAHEPEGRYADAGEFREALRTARASVRVEASVAGVLHQLSLMNDLEGLGYQDRREILSRARFELEQALRETPEDVRVSNARERVCAESLEAALEAGRLDDAEAALRALNPASHEQIRAVELLGAKTSEEDARRRVNQAAASARSLRRGAQIRATIGNWFCVSWLLAHFGIGWMQRAGIHQFAYYETVVFVTAACLPCAAALWIYRDRTLANMANRRLYASLVFLLLAQGVVYCVTSYAGIDPALVGAVSLLGLASGAGYCAIFLDVRMLACGVPALALALLCLVEFEYVYEWLGIAYVPYFILGARLSFDRPFMVPIETSTYGRRGSLPDEAG